MALAEAVENRGAWLALPVGLGKTLISYALPRLLESCRPLLLVPGAGLRTKTESDFAKYAGVWRPPPTPPRIKTIESLRTAKQAQFLDEMRPDLIMVDECDALANRDASVPARIDRYVVANEDVIVVVMTGTPGRNSIMNYWHLLCWALRDRAPVPMREAEAGMWAAAIDRQTRPGAPRPGPGPLGRTVADARAWFKRRLAETPGVMIVDGDSCDAPLTVRVRLAKEDEHSS
jgi:hypothetical protein